MATSTATTKTSPLLNQYTSQPDGSQVSGTFTANGVTSVTVVNTYVKGNSSVVITLKTVGGTVGAIPSIKTITSEVGFTVSGTALDTSVYNYKII